MKSAVKVVSVMFTHCPLQCPELELFREVIISFCLQLVSDCDPLPIIIIMIMIMIMIMIIVIIIIIIITIKIITKKTVGFYGAFNEFSMRLQ